MFLTLVGVTMSYNHSFLDDFNNQAGGMICFHSLKNPTFPE